ncbi:MAG: PaaI family thioesterase [Solirubrobacteraceae bacterium]
MDFLELIGPVEHGDGVTRLQTEERHANPAGAVHGGLIATLCDTAVGAAVAAEAEEIAGAVTVSLTVDYLAPAKPGSLLEARTEIEKLGGRLAFADCRVSADGKEVVRARAVFSVLD